MNQKRLLLVVLVLILISIAVYLSPRFQRFELSPQDRLKQGASSVCGKAEILYPCEGPYSEAVYNGQASHGTFYECIVKDERGREFPVITDVVSTPPNPGEKITYCTTSVPVTISGTQISTTAFGAFP